MLFLPEFNISYLSITKFLLPGCIFITLPGLVQAVAQENEKMIRENAK